MSKRGSVLELAVLGLLHQSPMHGYELRKRLNLVLGSFRALSYGSLYPCLKSLVERNWIEGTESVETPPAVASKRARIVYQLTADGKEHLQQVLASSGPATWEDENFDVRFAFFGRTDMEIRLRVLEGRRSRLQERLDRIQSQLDLTAKEVDSYHAELQRHGVESAQREVEWLSDLINAERSGHLKPQEPTPPAPGPA